MAVEVIWEDRGLYRKYSGIVTSKDLVRVKEQNLGDERFDRLLYTICDFRDVERFDHQKTDLDFLCVLDRSTATYHGSLFIAAVARDERVCSVLESLKNSRISPYPRALFPSVPDARNWISNELKSQGFEA